jgi:hypothetical protein
LRSFILLTFLFLGIGFYELSGGADFEPESRPGTAVAAAEPVAPAVPETVTRADPDAIAGLDALPGVPERLARPLVSPEVSAAEQAVAAAVMAAIAAPVPEAQPEATPVLASLATALGTERYVEATALNVRAGPSTNDRVLTRLTQNAAVTVLSDLGDGWSLVRVGSDGTEGWVASEFLSR